MSTICFTCCNVKKLCNSFYVVYLYGPQIIQSYLPELYLPTHRHNGDELRFP